MIIGIEQLKYTKDEEDLSTIIQYLVANSKKDNIKVTFKDFKKSKNIEILTSEISSGFKIKKFSDKPKDILRLLIGCTIHELEDNDFMNKELGEDWIVWDITSYNKAKTIYLTPNKLLGLITYNINNSGTNKLQPNLWVKSLLHCYKHPTYYYMCERCNDLEIDENSLLEIKSRFVEQGYTENEFVCPNCKGKEKESDLVKVILEGENWIIEDADTNEKLENIRNKGGINIKVDTLSPNPNPILNKTDNKYFDYVITDIKNFEDFLSKVEFILKEQDLI